MEYWMPDPDWFGSAGGAHPTLLALGVDTVMAELDQLLATPR